jgi:hypothetical protein
MRTHDHDALGPETLRPKGTRLTEPDALQMKAALAGRLDVLSPSGVLGLQRAIGNGGTAGILEDEERSPVHDVVATAGEPLANDVRGDMESRLGHNFGDVRVHSDGAADASARSVNAHAYTVGSHVVFQRSAYDPSSQEGRTTLAHELTHVVQQRSGPVDGTPAACGISVSDPSDRFEREAAAGAEQAMSTPAPVASAATPGQLQRQTPQDELEEESVQGAFVQREDPAEMEEEAPAG